jgi:two-component system NtrC family sensor kinase
VTRLRNAERSLIQAERLSSLGGVVAGVAHELNNPLSGVVGYAELLRTHATHPDQLRDLDRIVESALRCQKIVMNLLSFARKHPPEKRYRSLNDCIHKVLELKSYQLRSSQIETVLDLDPAIPHTSYDFHQIEQVVLNLLNNAEQALRDTDHVGRIVLRTRADREAVWLEVEDDGPGVSPDARDRVFDPFFTTKGIGEGTGLGLSVSYGIVQQHGGTITVEDAPGGRGALFRVSLPIVLGPAPAAGETIPPLRTSSLTGKSILVAEDDPTVLELFARVLSAEGARVTLVQDGAEAWHRLERGSYDLIVADLRMPNLSGQQLYERVAEERPEMLRRFVFATGDLVRDETRDFLARLPNRILHKPLEVETVRRVLAQAIGAAA